jgi:hypothetical protein
MIRRRLRDYRDLRFISYQVLTGRLRSSGGGVLYEMSEPFLNDRPVESVPRTSSSSRDQAIFVDQAAGASLPSDAVLLEIDRFG